MPRNILFAIIGALVVATGVLAYNLYQERKQPDGVQISIGSRGITVEEKK